MISRSASRATARAGISFGGAALGITTGRTACRGTRGRVHVGGRLGAAPVPLGLPGPAGGDLRAVRRPDARDVRGGDNHERLPGRRARGGRGGAVRGPVGRRRAAPARAGGKRDVPDGDVAHRRRVPEPRGDEGDVLAGRPPARQGGRVLRVLRGTAGGDGPVAPPARDSGAWVMWLCQGDGSLDTAGDLPRPSLYWFDQAFLSVWRGVSREPSPRHEESSQRVQTLSLDGLACSSGC